MSLQQKFNLGKCFDCNKERSGVGWCKDCEINAFKRDFKSWTSGDPKIDSFIQHTQLNGTGCHDYLEYIDYKQFDLVKSTNKKSSFSTIFSAIWLEGPRWIWDEAIEQWTRNGPIKVALKRLENMSEEYLNNVCQNIYYYFLFFFCLKVL